MSSGRFPKFICFVHLIIYLFTGFTRVDLGGRLEIAETAILDNVALFLHFYNYLIFNIYGLCLKTYYEHLSEDVSGFIVWVVVFRSELRDYVIV